jgi:hypothetical protein
MPKPNHLGMAYATLMTGDLMSDYALLKSQGVVFLSEPYGAPGNRFVVHALTPTGSTSSLRRVPSCDPAQNPEQDPNHWACPTLALM